MKKFTLAISLLISLNASAALYDRGNGLIYDSGLNITWLQDANYAKTSGYDADGQMTWLQSKAWADNLVYGDFSDWRLASAGLIASNDDPLSFDGSTNRSYNNTRSEIGHLFIELGNVAICNTAGSCTQPDHGFIHTGPFLNVQNSIYWEGEQYQNTASAWIFLAETGFQISTIVYGDFYAWAVRDGDVAAVPVPATAWLFGSGLIGLAGVAKRQRKLVN